MKKLLGLLLVGGALGAAMPATAQTYTGAGMPIYDLQTASSTINVSSPATVTGVTFTLNGLTHTYLSDLYATLTHGGTTVRWLNRTNPSVQLNGDYTISDQGLTTIGGGSGNPRASGTYAAFDPLSAFIGMSGAGDWTLTISDQVGRDSGNLNGWSLSLAAAASAAPEPATWALMIMGFGAVGGAMRRRAAVRTAVRFA